ncbi:hypothetical protein ANCCAN_05016 [Ancylostoma caninum]|uniref:Uncharacterized protein n=1 Tax=Ancylostoma caninum TaxID=29170 RepID=A0A368H112_ANCCA|nr:hypothetical protein ANCCAN_05016 [Ancylostoma caninum]
MRLFAVVLLIADVYASSRLDRITDSAMEVLATANLGTTIRQCSCDEDAECVRVMQDQCIYHLVLASSFIEVFSSEWEELSS